MIEARVTFDFHEDCMYVSGRLARTRKMLSQQFQILLP